MSNKVYISGFGDNSVNGTYYQVGSLNGYPAYQKNSDYSLVYFAKNMPYCFEGAYYIVRRTAANGSIPINRPLYMKLGFDLFGSSTSWRGMEDITSNSNGTGTEVFNDDSSLDSSDSLDLKNMYFSWSNTDGICERGKSFYDNFSIPNYEYWYLNGEGISIAGELEHWLAEDGQHLSWLVLIYNQDGFFAQGNIPWGSEEVEWYDSNGDPIVPDNGQWTFDAQGLPIIDFTWNSYNYHWRSIPFPADQYFKYTFISGDTNIQGNSTYTYTKYPGYYEGVGWSEWDDTSPDPTGNTGSVLSFDSPVSDGEFNNIIWEATFFQSDVITVGYLFVDDPIPHFYDGYNNPITPEVGTWTIHDGLATIDFQYNGTRWQWSSSAFSITGTLLYSGGSTILQGNEFNLYGSEDVYSGGETYDQKNNAFYVDAPLDVVEIDSSGYYLNGTFNLSVCPNIDYLEFYDNLLSSLDVSGLAVLTHLSCNRNLLTSINISGCIDLSYITLADNLLSESQIDGILLDLVNGEVNGGYAELNGTGNSAPSAAGLINRQILLDDPRSWSDIIVNEDESSSSSSSSSSEVRSSSSSSSSQDCLLIYHACYPFSGAISGDYEFNSTYYNGKYIYSNGSYNLWYDVTNVWVISTNAGDPSGSWSSHKINTFGCPDGLYTSTNGEMSAEACPT